MTRAEQITQTIGAYNDILDVLRSAPSIAIAVRRLEWERDVMRREVAKELANAEQRELPFALSARGLDEA